MREGAGAGPHHFCVPQKTMFNRKTSPLCDVIATSLSREFLSDRKTLFTQLKPIRLFSLGATRMAIVVADHGNSIMEQYSDDLDLLEAQLQERERKRRWWWSRSGKEVG